MSLKRSRLVWLALFLLSLTLGWTNRQGSAQTSTQGAIAGTTVDGSGGVAIHRIIFLREKLQESPTPNV